MNEKSVNKEVAFLKWFSELNKDSGPVAGGKGSNLGEISHLDVPVPQGFVITAQAYDYFIQEAELKQKIKDAISKINNEDTKQLDEVTLEVRKWISTADFPEEMEKEIFKAYDQLGSMKFEEKDKKGVAYEVLTRAPEPIFVAVRSSATTEDLAEASFAGQQESFLFIKGKTNLIQAIKDCFASLFTARAVYYRNKQGFGGVDASLAVVIQKMIDSEKSGVMFSKNPSYNDDNVIVDAVWGVGEGIVSGAVTPDEYIVSRDSKIISKKISEKKTAIVRNSAGTTKTVELKDNYAKQQVISDDKIKKLAAIALKLEEHYGKPQDIEFALDNQDDIYIVQTRPITTMEHRIDRPSDESSEKEIKGEVVLEGMPASPGIGVGKVKIVLDLKDLDKVLKGDILVTKMTNPDMVVTMQKCSAIVIDEGGLTAHASIVSREMGIPCVVGTQAATSKLKDDEIITVDGYHGKVYRGEVAKSEKKEVVQITSNTKTKIKVIVDLPSFAERASKTGIKAVGLTRIEGIIAESGKHPNYFIEKNNMKDYEEIIFKGVKGISDYFEEVWIRTSDIRSDEFQDLEGAPKEKEANPMLGMHGIRYGIVHPEILKSELNALKRISETGKTVGIILPQIISVGEVIKVKQFLNEINYSNAKLGVMIETPAAVQIINELCQEGIKFISFGTNDLTQYILAIDRGNEKVQSLYDEMHPAVLHQLEYVIRTCKRNGVETSICGQAGSKKEMVKFLIQNKIDSISVNADVAKEISDYVKQLEDEMINGTDKEPRKYQPGK